MKRVTDSPLLRGELDILQRRRRIKFPGEFPYYTNECWAIIGAKLDHENEDRLYRNAAIFKLTQSDIPEMNIGKMPTR